MNDILVWKVVFFSTALVASILTGLVCLLAMIDFVKVRLEKVNGAVQFMTLDNFRHQGFLTVASLILLMCALFLLSAPVARTGGLAILSVLTALTVVDAVFSLFRRPKMAKLVGEYLADMRKGGRRKTDPPADDDGGEGW